MLYMGFSQISVTLCILTPGFSPVTSQIVYKRADAEITSDISC